MMHRLIASLAVTYGIAPDVLADCDPDLFNALVRRYRRVDDDVKSDADFNPLDGTVTGG